MGLAVDEIYADRAVLIPELLTGLPYSFFATSAIDAFILSLIHILFSSSRDWQRMLINEMPGSVTRWSPLRLRNCHFIRKAFDTHGIKLGKAFQ